MNWVDLSIILVLAFFAIEGLESSFIGESLDFLSFFLALIFSVRFYNLVSSLLQLKLQIPHSLSNVLGFFLVWSMVEVALSLLVRAFLAKVSFLESIDHKLRTFSVIPSFLRGLIFIAIILVLIATFPIQPQLKTSVDQSKLGSVILEKAYQLETPLKNIFGGITKDTLTFLTVEPKAGEQIDLGFKTTNFFANESLENQMIGLVNKERTNQGLKELTFDPKLRGIARDHSSDMFTRGYFSHYSPEGKNVANRAEEAGIDYQVIGENLAYAPNLELAHNGLMNSPGHRANILSEDFNKVGIGIMDGGGYGLMITQVFSN